MIISFSEKEKRIFLDMWRKLLTFLYTYASMKFSYLKMEIVVAIEVLEWLHHLKEIVDVDSPNIIQQNFAIYNVGFI